MVSHGIPTADAMDMMVSAFTSPIKNVSLRDARGKLLVKYVLCKICCAYQFLCSSFFYQFYFLFFLQIIACSHFLLLLKGDEVQNPRRPRHACAINLRLSRILYHKSPDHIHKGGTDRRERDRNDGGMVAHLRIDQTDSLSYLEITEVTSQRFFARWLYLGI